MAHFNSKQTFYRLTHVRVNIITIYTNKYIKITCILQYAIVLFHCITYVLFPFCRPLKESVNFVYVNECLKDINQVGLYLKCFQKNFCSKRSENLMTTLFW